MRLVSMDCLDCLMEDVTEAYKASEGVVIHPMVLQRMVHEIITARARQFAQSAVASA